MAAAPVNTNLSNADWDTLITKIREKNCTPFIGAGVSVPTLPLAAELAEALLRDDEPKTGPCPLPERTDLSKVAQYLAISRDDYRWPKDRIVEHIQRAGFPPADNPLEAHRVLARLRLPVYLTTNYDNFMISALRAERPQAKQEISRWTPELLRSVPSAFDDGYEPSQEIPIVFHLHGNIGNPDSIVVSEDDYLEYLVNISHDFGTKTAQTKSMLPLPVQSAITNKTLLFLGYSLRDINFRVVLRALFRDLSVVARRVNFTIQFPGDESEALKEYLQKYFKQTFNVKVFEGSAQAFARELHERLPRELQ